MQSMIHDGSFEGFLTTVFQVYDLGLKEVEICSEGKYQQNIFGGRYFVSTELLKAERVWKGLQQKISAAALQQFYKTWLSEIDGIENTMLSYVRHVFSSTVSVEKDFSHPAILLITDTAKKVHREKHRMEAFVRFQLTKDQLYFAIVEPDFNVLPIIQKHFKSRYADQRWMIYDGRRKYGIYYDLDKVDYIQVNFDEKVNSGKDIRGQYSESEVLYQDLWKTYFGSINIAARKNMKLHIQHMPRRYWKYLTEK